MRAICAKTFLTALIVQCITNSNSETNGYTTTISQASTKESQHINDHMTSNALTERTTTSTSPIITDMTIKTTNMTQSTTITDKTTTKDKITTTAGTTTRPSTTITEKTTTTAGTTTRPNGHGLNSFFVAGSCVVGTFICIYLLTVLVDWCKERISQRWFYRGRLIEVSPNYESFNVWRPELSNQFSCPI